MQSGAIGVPFSSLRFWWAIDRFPWALPLSGGIPLAALVYNLTPWETFLPYRVGMMLTPLVWITIFQIAVVESWELYAIRNAIETGYPPEVTRILDETISQIYDYRSEHRSSDQVHQIEIVGAIRDRLKIHSPDFEEYLLRKVVLYCCRGTSSR